MASLRKRFTGGAFLVGLLLLICGGLYAQVPFDGTWGPQENTASPTFTGTVTLDATGTVLYTGRATLTSPATGKIRITDPGAGAVTALQLETGVQFYSDGSTSAALYQSNGSTKATLEVLNLTASASSGLRWDGRSEIKSDADSDVTLYNAANNAFDCLKFGGTSSSFPAICRSSATLALKLADESTGTAKLHFATATGTIAVDDTTPSVAGANYFLTSANTGATAITDLDDPTPGQVVTICGGSDTNSSTIGDSGNFNLSGAFTAALDDCITLFVQADNDYIELSRVNN